MNCKLIQFIWDGIKSVDRFLLFLPPDGLVAQLNRASDYGSEGFEVLMLVFLNWLCSSIE